jgi:hypothetical protein
MLAGVSSTSVALPAAPLYSQLNLTFAAQAVASLVAPKQRFSLSGTTTIFLVVQCSFTTSTLTGNGNIQARRVR